MRWRGVEDYYPFKAQNGVVLYAEKFMRQQPDAARRWMVGYLRGVRAYQQALASGQEIDAIYAILAKYTDVKDRSLYPKMQPVDLALDGRIETRSLEWDQDWFIKLGLQRERANLAKVIDYQYVDYAAEQLRRRQVSRFRTSLDSVALSFAFANFGIEGPQTTKHSCLMLIGALPAQALPTPRLGFHKLCVVPQTRS